MVRDDDDADAVIISWEVSIYKKENNLGERFHNSPLPSPSSVIMMCLTMRRRLATLGNNIPAAVSITIANLVLCLACALSFISHGPRRRVDIETGFVLQCMSLVVSVYWLYCDHTWGGAIRLFSNLFSGLDLGRRMSQWIFHTRSCCI